VNSIDKHIMYIRSDKPSSFGGGRGGGGGFGGSSRGQGRPGEGITRRNDRFNGRVEKPSFGGMQTRSRDNKNGLDEQVLKRINWGQETLS